MSDLIGRAVAQRIGEVRAGMQRDVPELLQHGLHTFLDKLQADLQGLAEIIGTAFFRDWRPLRQVPAPTMTQTMGGMTQTL